jgi:hypothetical protein
MLAVIFYMNNFSNTGGESWVDFGVLLFLLLVNGVVGFIEDHKYVRVHVVVAFANSAKSQCKQSQSDSAAV